MAGLELDIVALLALVAVGAGFVDAIAGGGGMITVPALMLAGLDPVSAVATNKLQGTFGVAVATHRFARAGMIDWRDAATLACVASVAAIAGALAVRVLPVTLVAAAMPVLLIAVAVYFALSRKVRDEDARARISRLAFTLAVVVPVGFYDGLLGPGAGSFYMLGFVTLLGFGVVRATAHTKLLNFASNLGGLALFAATGAVLWPLGLAMAAGQLVGARLGASLALRHGARLIRPLIVVVCCLMALRLLLDSANPLGQWLLSLLP